MDAIVFWRFKIPVGAVQAVPVEDRLIQMLTSGFEDEYPFIWAFELVKDADNVELNSLPTLIPNTL